MFKAAVVATRGADLDHHVVLDLPLLADLRLLTQSDPRASGEEISQERIEYGVCSPSYPFVEPLSSKKNSSSRR